MKQTIKSLIVSIFFLSVLACEKKELQILPALHVISVNKGQLPLNGLDEEQWVAKCFAESVNKESARYECRDKLQQIDNTTDREVIVNVSENTTPIILVLVSNTKTLWKISPNKDVNLVKVIVGSPESQRITGLSNKTPVEYYTQAPSTPCERCWQTDKYLTSYQEPPKELKEITGLEVSTFQVKQNGAEFSIYPNMKKYDNGINFSEDNFISDQVRTAIRRHHNERTEEIAKKIRESKKLSEQFLYGVSNGEGNWLEIANFFKNDMNAATWKELDQSLFKALLKKPYEVIPFLQHSIWSPWVICVFDKESGLPFSLPEYLEALEFSLQSDLSISSSYKDMYKKCQKGIEKSRSIYKAESFFH